MINKFKVFVPIIFLLFSTSLAIGQNSNIAIANKGEQEPEKPANSTIRARVYFQATGRSVRRSSIVLITENDRGEVSGITDNNGLVEFKNVAAGKYYAIINAPGVVSPIAYVDLEKPRNEGFPTLSDVFKPIIVDGINNIDTQIPAIQGGAISGRVTYANGDPAIGVRIEVLRKVGDKFLPVLSNMLSFMAVFTGGPQTDDRGMYRFSGLPEGEYIVKITENVSHNGILETANLHNPFGGLFSRDSLLTVYYPNVSNSAEAQIVNLTLGVENYETNLTIPERNLYQVEGKIIALKDKTPIKNAKLSLKKVGDNTVSLYEGSAYDQNNKSSEQGIWKFKELPKGKYKLIIEPPDPEYDMPDYPANDYPMNDYPMNKAIDDYSDNSAMNTANRAEDFDEDIPPRFARQIREITIEDENLSGIVIELGYGAIISGTVRTENSEEMPNSVNIFTSDESGEMTASTSVDNYKFSADDMKKDANYNGSIDDLKDDEELSEKTFYDFYLDNIFVGKNLFYIEISDENFYVKSAMAGTTDLLAAPFELKEGEHLQNVKIILAKDVGTIKGKILDSKKQPLGNTRFLLVPVNSGRRNKTFFRQITSDENGNFEMQVPPDEYSVIIYKEPTAKDFDAFYKWLDKEIKDAQKVTVKPNETIEISLAYPAK